MMNSTPAGTAINNYNNDNSRTVNQTNNSPKSLSRLEIYRMTRNALNVQSDLFKLSQVLLVASIPIAPSGAVISIARTATESMIFPQGKPSDNGTEPIAA